MPQPTFEDFEEKAVEMAQRRVGRESKQDTIDDVEMWLSSLGHALKGGCLGEDGQTGKPDAVRLADRCLKEFRHRWPRRDGKDPLSPARTVDSDLEDR